jgi:hypothetical protein
MFHLFICFPSFLPRASTLFSHLFIFLSSAFFTGAKDFILTGENPQN